MVRQKGMLNSMASSHVQMDTLLLLLMYSSCICWRSLWLRILLRDSPRMTGTIRGEMRETLTIYSIWEQAMLVEKRAMLRGSGLKVRQKCWNPLLGAGKEKEMVTLRLGA